MAAMSDVSGHDQHLRNLRAWRNPPQRDLTLSGLAADVEKRFVRPAKQVGELGKLWEELLPGRIVERTALAGFTRGVLTVHVADSATRYELDRLLRGGLERQIKQASRQPVRKVKLKVTAVGR